MDKKASKAQAKADKEAKRTASKREKEAKKEAKRTASKRDKDAAKLAKQAKSAAGVVSSGTSFGEETKVTRADGAPEQVTLVPMPQPGRAPHRYHEMNPDTMVTPSFPELASRKSMAVNPWRTISAATVRPRLKVRGQLQRLIDEAATSSPWYGLHLPRDAATAILDNNLDALGDGAFVVAPAGQDFAVVCMISKGQLLNVPITETDDGLVLRAPGAKKKARAFASLAALVQHYSQRSQHGLPCPLQPAALDGLDTALPLYVQSPGLELMYSPVAADAPLLEARPEAPRSPSMGPATPGHDPGRSVVNNPMYGDATTPAHEASRTAVNPTYGSTPGGAATPSRTTVNPAYGVSGPAPGSANRTTVNPSYAGVPMRARDGSVIREADRDSVLSFHGYEEMSPASSDAARLANLSLGGTGGARAAASAGSAEDSYLSLPSPSQPDEPVHLGYISISRECFTRDGHIGGISFSPCQTNEWFFIGLSNVQENYHGRRDSHYDDIDFCIFCMGNGKATARECEDEVGPYVKYEPGKQFQLRIARRGKGSPGVVEYVYDGTVFYTSTRTPCWPVWVDQAFHPANLGQTLIKNVHFIS